MTSSIKQSKPSLGLGIAICFIFLIFPLLSSVFYLKTTLLINGFPLKADIDFTPQQRSHGLGFKNYLLENQGMLFVFDVEGLHPFWMKGMKFPIDIIWLNKEKKILAIEKYCQICKDQNKCPVYSPQIDSRYVFEVPAGFSENHYFKVGDSISLKYIY